MAQSAILHPEKVTRRRGGAKESTAASSPSSNSHLRKRRRKAKRPVSSTRLYVLLLVSASLVFFLFYLSLARSVVHSTITTNATGMHSHVIPNILIFTHRYNLLTADVTNLPNLTKDEREELLALQQNVRRVIGLHPGARVRFLTDDDCIRSLQSVERFAELVPFFKRERQGMFKADLCRGMALVETGGLYFDVDLGVRMNVWDVLEHDTDFATVRVHLQSQHRGAFFQAFMASTPGHAIVVRYVDLFLQYYRGELGTIKGPLGVLLLKRAWDEVRESEESDVSNGTSIADTAEIWQEVLYMPELQKNLLKDIPPPRWGVKRACKFIVISSPELPVMVPFYSRVAGSRMCPILNETEQKESQYYYELRDPEAY